jgi:hypothetical protein
MRYLERLDNIRQDIWDVLSNSYDVITVEFDGALTFFYEGHKIYGANVIRIKKIGLPYNDITFDLENLLKLKEKTDAKRVRRDNSQFS